MNEEILNFSVRKFLKNVGVNSQRIIETNIRQAVKDKRIKSSTNLNITMDLKVSELNLNETIEGKIEIKF